MKRTFIFFMIFAVGSIFSSNAQNLQVGINGGFLKNRVIVENNNSDRPSWNKERLNSFNWGFNLGYNLSRHWNIETQVQFVKLEYKERLEYLYHPTNNNGGWLPVEIDWYNSHHYIRVPLLIHYNFFPNQSNFGISLFAGPDFGFNSKQTTLFTGVNETGKLLTSTIDKMEMPLNQVDIGLKVGFKIKAQTYKSFSLFIEGAMYHGGTSIINYPEQGYNRPTENYEYYDFVNRYFTTQIGILYNFATKQPKN